jgi:hypothetical protein
MQQRTVHQRDRLRRSGSTPVDAARAFASGRAGALDRLVRGGIPRAMAEAWIEIWDQSTIGLPDFRSAPDFWTLGYRYAQEEYERGYRPIWRRDISTTERDSSLP